MHDAAEIKIYWDNRAEESNGNPSATTQDIFLRRLEIKTLVDSITKLRINGKIKILDIGCGDGYSTMNIARKISNSDFVGIDYSAKMIENARKNLAIYRELENRVTFKTGDVTAVDEIVNADEFDFIITDRCLINLISAEAQYDAIKRIYHVLKPGGFYLAIENFNEGQIELNKARAAVGLNEIKIRWHNNFFNQKEFLQQMQDIFSDVQLEEFSSAYYFATRVIYSKYCQIKNEEPDYEHEIHRLAVDLPSYGSYSPIKLAVLKK